VQLDQVRRIEVADRGALIEVGLTTFSAPLWDQTRQELQSFVQSQFPSLSQVEVRVVTHERPAEKIGEVGLTAKGVVAVGSGKGGVGKSTIAASLALGLKYAGCKVGLLDADVYGPSIPHLLGLDERPQAVERKLQPVVADGLRVMSMGFLVPPGEAVVWRGPMLHGAITQFLRDTEWGDLDYLIIDMPPGTGDIALTLSQLLPLSGAVVVCTPQDVALLDAVKAIAMFRKVHIDLLGLVENMSFFECPGCGGRYEIFGSGGAKRRALELDVPFLGELPINIQLRIRGDEGHTAANFGDQAISKYLHTICLNLVKNIVAGRKEAPALPSLSVL
jgi:ATP-binding protein involved in chromosome partitioning